jgi:hypothetical protein
VGALGSSHRGRDRGHDGGLSGRHVLRCVRAARPRHARDPASVHRRIAGAVRVRLGHGARACAVPSI